MCGWQLWWFCCHHCDVASWGVDIGSGGSDDMVVVVWVMMQLRWVNELPHFGPNTSALDGGGCYDFKDIVLRSDKYLNSRSEKLR